MRVFFVYIPQGRPMAADEALIVLSDLQAEALRTFDGLTIHPAAEGFWIDNGRTYVDLVSPWEIATDDEAAVRRFAEIVRKATNQIAVYVREGGTASIITGG